ncbi:hypothetical protein SOV_17070 [Sporomusa ovata DSM 2662]|uniref:Uncharacterized protein n=1 Tax=Sporomusa ovata TaxID=2378 RepID=A0A0U1KV90_9FIRM|nr:hypothetical protein [Sporomusa ovata]EQB29307.1 hypothetical protein SOV_1c10400 [Sporomusa ovata DSM 2662]CQR71348.1 hypothetical protein SpAn4DRAFT_3853 [Sporomusa ovata]
MNDLVQLVEKDGVSGWDQKLKTFWRRLERVTDNEDYIKEFRELMVEKNLTGTDLMTILKVVKVRPGNEHVLK